MENARVLPSVKTLGDSGDPAGVHPPAHPQPVDRVSLIVERGHPAANGDPEIHPAALTAMPLALLGPTFSTRAMINRYLRRNGVQPHVAVEANSTAAIVEIVRLAGLATILPETVAQAH